MLLVVWFVSFMWILRRVFHHSYFKGECSCSIFLNNPGNCYNKAYWSISSQLSTFIAHCLLLFYLFLFEFRWFIQIKSQNESLPMWFGASYRCTAANSCRRVPLEKCGCNCKRIWCKCLHRYRHQHCWCGCCCCCCCGYQFHILKTRKKATKFAIIHKPAANCAHTLQWER